MAKPGTGKRFVSNLIDVMDGFRVPEPVIGGVETADFQTCGNRGRWAM
jgi:hypothetical protein